MQWGGVLGWVSEGGWGGVGGGGGGGLQNLCELGSFGEQPQNCLTGLYKIVKDVLGVALMPMYIALVPLKVLKGGIDAIGPQLSSMGFLLPHVWFWYLHHHYPAEFASLFVGCAQAMMADRVSEFWTSLHPADPKRAKCKYGIPVGLHGDGVSCTKRDSINVLSMFGLLGGFGTTYEKILYCYGYFCKTKFDETDFEAYPGWESGITDSVCWRILAWSLPALKLG